MLCPPIHWSQSKKAPQTRHAEARRLILDPVTFGALEGARVCHPALPTCVHEEFCHFDSPFFIDVTEATCTVPVPSRLGFLQDPRRPSIEFEPGRRADAFPSSGQLRGPARSKNYLLHGTHSAHLSHSLGSCAARAGYTCAERRDAHYERNLARTYHVRGHLHTGRTLQCPGAFRTQGIPSIAQEGSCPDQLQEVLQRRECRGEQRGNRQGIRGRQEPLRGRRVERDGETSGPGQVPGSPGKGVGPHRYGPSQYVGYP